MNGYVQNKSPMWAHAMKRTIGPGQKIPLNELFEQYGKKHSLSEGDEFVAWLRTVKLKDHTKWSVVLLADDEVIVEKEIVDVPTEDDVKKRIDDMDPLEIVDLTVRKARELVPVCKNKKLLKMALRDANARSHKDSLCNILRKRIRELETIVRN